MSDSEVRVGDSRSAAERTRSEDPLNTSRALLSRASTVAYIADWLDTLTVRRRDRHREDRDL